MSRPSFATTVAALRTADPRFPWIGPTPDEAEVADVLEELEELHQPTADMPDERGRFGRCTGCATSWPCDAWRWGEQEAIQWLGRAADRVHAHANAAVNRGKPSNGLSGSQTERPTTDTSHTASARESARTGAGISNQAGSPAATIGRNQA